MQVTLEFTACDIINCKFYAPTRTFNSIDIIINLVARSINLDYSV